MNLHNWKVTRGSVDGGFLQDGTGVGLGMMCPSLYSLDCVVGFVVWFFFLLFQL